MIGAKSLPQEGAVREGFGVPVIAPGSVRWVVCNLIPIDRVVAYSCPGGWVQARMKDDPTVMIRLEGRVEVA